MAIVDVHAHLDPRMLELGAMIEKLDACGVDRVVLIPCMNDPIPETPDALLAVLRRVMQTPARRAVKLLDRLLYTPEGHLKLKGKVFRIYSRPDNQPVADAIAAHPDRFSGWIFLNPRGTTDSRAELERWRAVPGFIGVKLHPFWHRYPLADALAIARECEVLDLPVLIHLGLGDSGDWKPLAEACPKLRIVFAHAGIPQYNKLWDDIAPYPRLVIDVSSPFLDERLVRRAVARLGADRVLYGTDAPYGFHHGPDHAYDYAHIKGWVERLPCPARDIDRMLGGNAEQLLADRR